MAENPLRIMVIGAHPDDPDVSAGGTVALYTRAGHQVQMVSLTNGDAGHMEIGGAPLAWRRRLEAQAAGRTLGAAYLVLDHHDGELVPDLDLRREVIRLIRSFGPDLVLAPRPWDYHPDHRAAGQVVQDASYLLTVPNAVSDTPHLERMPVIAHLWDRFQTPCPFRADIAVDIDPTLEDKVDALACHESQMFEWLPYNRQELDQVPTDPAARREWMGAWYGRRFSQAADQYRPLLVERYGSERGSAVRYAEALEISEYGGELSPDEIHELLPW